MEKFYDYASKALKSYNTADHLVHMTYGVVKDPKLMLLAATHLKECFDDALSAFLYYDYYYKRISTFPQDFNSKLDLFKRFTCKRYGIPREVAQVILDVHKIHRDHKSSEMEFRRRNNFVIASKNYRLRTINSEKLKNFLVLSKPLLSKLSEVKKLNDRRIS
jgi:hypothetical protein